jgi:prevent-host-death family protein
MSDTIRQSDLRNDNAVIMRRVAAGESFVITVNGRPVADLVPHQRESSRRRFVPTSELDDAMASLPPVDAQGWARDLADANEYFGPDHPEDPFTPRGGRGVDPQ